MAHPLLFTERVLMRKYVDLAKQTFQEFGEDKAQRLGAALAYYTIFSIGPLLLIAVSMAGLFLGQEAAQGQVSDELGKFFGPHMAKSLEEMVQAAAKPKSGKVATIIGFITLFLGASGVFGQLKDALNTIWNVETKRVSGVMSFVKQRFLSMAMVLGIGFLLLVTLLIDAVVSAMGGLLERFVGGEALMHIIQLAVSFAIATLLFAAIFRILPDLKIAWRDVWLGAVLTSILFVLGKFLLGLYIGKAALGSAYGAAGSLIVLVVWVYWSAQILFLGAEFTQVWARTHGSLAGDTSKRQARSQAARPEDRPRVPASGGLPGTPHMVPAPVHAPSSGKSGGGIARVAAGGVAGLLLGAVVGAISAVVMVLKSARKIFIPFR